MKLLVVAETIAVLSFVAVAGYSLFDQATPITTIDVQALATGAAEEQWYGVFVKDQHVGYGMYRQIPASEGTIFQEQSFLKINAMGSIQTIINAGTALVGPNGQLSRFDMLLSSPLKMSVQGEVRGKSIHLEVSQGGATKGMDIAIQEPPVISTTLGGLVKGKTLSPGMELSVPYFDIATLSNSAMRVTVETPVVLPNGDNGWWLRTEVSGTQTRRLIDERGKTLREETSTLGFSTRAMTKAEATNVPDTDPPDLVALASAPFTGSLPLGRDTRFLKIRVTGVEASRFLLDPPLQSVEGDALIVTLPRLDGFSGIPIRGDTSIEPTATLQALHPDIVAKAREVIGDAPDRLEAARRLNQFVFDYVEKIPTIGIPNGLEVLQKRQGDCNEHTALFVSLARAAGIPARISAGLVYSDRLGKAFYYHAWPEVLLNDTWLPLDPTFGQFPADATHLKIVNGDLDRQVEIMGMIGRVQLEVLESR